MPSHPPTNKKIGMMTIRIRSAGPMTLANYTNDEITHLRKAVSSPKSKIKYLALAFNMIDKSVQVVAQAYEKLSTTGWREVLGHRLKVIVSTGNLQATVEILKKNPGGFEEYGLFGRHGQHKPTAIKPEESMEEEKADTPASEKEDPMITMARRCGQLYLKRMLTHKTEVKSKRAFDSGIPMANPDTVRLARHHLKKPKDQITDEMHAAFLKRLRMHKYLDQLATRSNKRNVMNK